MGSTCGSGLCIDRPSIGMEELGEKHFSSKINGKQKDKRTKVDKFPDLTSQAAQMVDQLVDMDFQQQKIADSASPKFDKQAYLLENGWIYQGQWHKNKIWGKGRYYSPNKSYIQCYSIDGEPVGKLRLVHPNGDFYQGTTKNFKADGQGILYQNKIQYQGNFIQNYLHGQGREQSDSYIFEGIYEKGKKVSGKMVWNVGKPDETMYEGNFYNEKFDGRGAIYNSVGTFKGFFKEGKKFGEGAFFWKNGAHFEGEYANDMKNGPGLMFNPKGVLILKTVWKNDKPVVTTNSS